MECRVLANALVPLPLQGTTKPRWPLRRFGEKGRETEEARVAGERFFESLVRLKQRGILSAKHVCILAHQASAAGAAGPCNRLAKKDGLGSGKYSQHFDAVVGSPAKQKYYVADVPCGQTFDCTTSLATPARAVRASRRTNGNCALCASRRPASVPRCEPSVS